MGFQVGYSDLFLLKILLPFCTILGFYLKFIHTLLSFFGIHNFVEFEIDHSSPVSDEHESVSTSATLIKEFLPVVKFSDMEEIQMDTMESCAVCLYAFSHEEEIRKLVNCRHVFHGSCVDRWIDCDQKTCPLCRSQLIPEDMQDVFNEAM